jgi:TonB-dependent receptor
MKARSIVRARRLRARQLALVAAVSLALASAEAAEVRGRVTNAETGKPAVGAQVRTTSGTASATTDSEGRFTLGSLPPGPVTLVVTGGGIREHRADAVAGDDGRVLEVRFRTSEAERIVVTGIRAAELASIAAKREADTQVEVITSDEVGKLVDKNVADAVARLPGVTTATDKGEGRYVVIRGLEPTLANVTINNQTSASPEPESRQVKLDDVPAALIGEVTVVKVLTADRDANAIAGQVDIKTLTAFDRGRNFASARISGVKGDIHDKHGTEGDITVGGIFGDKKQFGAVLSYTRSKRPADSDDVIATGDVAWQVINGIEVPVSMDGRVYEPAFRTREGLVGNFDWQIDADSRAYARLTDSKFDDDEARQRFRFLFPTAASGYNNLTASGGNITGARGERYIRFRQEITETRTGTLGGEFRFGKDLLQAEASYTKATKDDPHRSEFRYRTGATAITGSFGLTGDFFDLTLSPAAYDPSRYLLNTFRDQFRVAKEELFQARVDYQVARDAWGSNSFLKFGAKYLDREKVNDQSGNSWTYTGPNFALTNATAGNIGSFFDGHYLFGPTTDFNASRAYFAANPGLFTLDRNGTLADSLAADYHAQEKIAAAYAMASISRGPLTIVPGVRVERTQADYKAIAVTSTTTQNDTYNSFGSRSYTDWFPSLAGKYEFHKHLLGRASVTTAIGRPDYDKVAPTISVDAASNTVTKGNPNLQPLKAVNLDASLEHYFPDGGILAGAIFYKKIDNPIFISTHTASGIFAGVPLVNASVTEPLNGERTTLTGIEVNLQRPFTFLPHPWDGFGVALNLTFVMGETKVPGRADKIPPPQQADRLANAQVYFEKWGFSSRLAYTWRSELLEIVGADARNDVYNDTNGVLSLKLAYNLTKQFQIFFEGNNLNNESDYRYAARTDRLVEGEKFGRIYRVGLTWSY